MSCGNCPSGRVCSSTTSSRDLEVEPNTVNNVELLCGNCNAARALNYYSDGLGLGDGRYQIEAQPSEARHLTHRWPMFAACASGHSHGIHPTLE
jgi:hypothetical protein